MLMHGNVAMLGVFQVNHGQAFSTDSDLCVESSIVLLS